MIKVLFVCHGNICRSPMAEFVFKDMVAKRGLADRFHIESCATSREEIGNPVYPPAKRKLAEHNIYALDLNHGFKLQSTTAIVYSKVKALEASTIHIGHISPAISITT
jgi:protein-tyrosine-phosphatase